MIVSSLIATLVVTSVPHYQSILDQFLVDQEIPGVSVAVTHEDEVLFAGASGLADIETGRLMTADTVMYAGSLTKIMTAVITLRLVDEGKLSLTDVVPGISAEKGNVSLFHLLTHTSGLDREGNFGYWFNGNFPDAADLSRYLTSTDLHSPPGETSRYSNIGYATLGTVIRGATGKEYGIALQTRLFEPLSMDSSAAPGPGPEVARGYSPIGRLIPNKERPFAGVGKSVGDRHLREYHNARAMTPAFGAYTTANDMAEFVQFLLGFGPDDILSDELRREMTAPQAFGRGLGLRSARLNDHRVARHDGWFAAHRSHLLLDLEANVGVVVIANSDNAAPALIAEALLAATLDIDSGEQ